MTQNTNIERVNTLLYRSDRIYDSIDEVIDGEPRYRRMLRMGMNMAAISLNKGYTVSEVGGMLIRLPHNAAPITGPLDALSNQYADVKRATIDRDGERETDARHAIHLMKLAVPYAREYYPRLDTPKVAAYALIHDLVEAYADDVSSLGISVEQKLAKDLAEAQAIETLKEEYGDRWPELVALVENYEALEDPEARFNKTFDKLDPGFTHFYSRGAQLRSRYNFTRESFLVAIDETTERMAAYSSEFPLLMDDRDELTRRVADIAYPKAA